MSLVAAGTQEELRRALTAQRAIAEAAVAEVLAAVDPAAVDPARYASAGTRVLMNYARYPTLTEFSRMPNLAAISWWGATFGVAALVGMLVLKAAQAVLGSDADMRLPYLLLLVRLDRPGREVALATPAEKVLAALSEQFGVLAAGGGEVALTAVGQRVLLHMFDAEIFVSEMLEAHARLRGASGPGCTGDGA